MITVDKLTYSYTKKPFITYMRPPKLIDFLLYLL